MIQRIQTIFLLLSAGAFGSLLTLPLAVANKPVVSSLYLEDAKVMAAEFPFGLLFVALGALAQIVAIFLFRNRNLQGRVTLLASTQAFIFLGLLTGGRWLTETLPPGNALLPHWGALTLILGLLFSVLAYLGIARDEKTVRSMDRLR